MTTNRSKRWPTVISFGFILLLCPFLAGCQTTGTTATTIKSQCAAWRAITYSAKGDTKLTVDQIRVHNAVGKRLGCWK